jgi:ribonuclease Y
MGFDITIVIVLAALVLGAAVTGTIVFALNRQKLAESSRLIEEARREAENIKREALLKAREEVAAQKDALERELKERRAEIQRLEERVIKREESVDAKLSALEQKTTELERRQREIQELEQKTQAIYEQQLRELERISGLSRDQAREIILKRVEEEARYEAARIIKQEEERAREEAERKAKELVALAIQRCASDHAAETTVSTVTLPSDDVKGRIIGREGRNIRTFENLTGINLIIDDTPDAVTLSSFDPVRREIARRTLEKLIADGRIHPARIEEVYTKVRDEIEEEFREVGEEAIFETGLAGIHPELVKTLGKLKFRTSYGQNVLKHSLEVAFLAGLMAGDLGLDVKMAKRAGLLHDIGKALDHEVEGPHSLIGGEFARRYKEPDIVVNAIEAHHGEVPYRFIEAVLIQAADAISASRPGARRETLESYIKRLEKLEEIAQSYEGVEKCYAMQAGREIRVIVKPTEMSDEDADILARTVAKRIEEEIQYPGQIKVTVIREHRAIEYAR